MSQIPDGWVKKMVDGKETYEPPKKAVLEKPVNPTPRQYTGYGLTGMEKYPPGLAGHYRKR